jgi:hypothetical protein
MALSPQRIDVVVVAIDLEVSERVDQVAHDLAAHRAELGGYNVLVAQDSGVASSIETHNQRGPI